MLIYNIFIYTNTHISLYIHGIFLSLSKHQTCRNHDILLSICIGVERSISGGGAIFIYSCSQTLKQSISKEINNAEHEYMNIVPPTYRSFDAYEYMNVRLIRQYKCANLV